MTLSPFDVHHSHSSGSNCQAPLSEATLPTVILAKHKGPRYIAFVNEFPMNAAGKTLKNKMREEAIEKLGLTAASKMDTV